MRRSMIALIAVMLSLLGWQPILTAEAPPTLRVPKNTKFVVHVDVKAFREDSELGAKLFGIAKSAALHELAEKTSGDSDSKASPEELMKKLTDMIGFDPFTEICGITVSAADYEHPEKSLIAVVQLKESTGNLEGMMLGVPGYESAEYHKYQIHSVAPEKEQRVFGSIHTDSHGMKSIVVSPHRENVEQLLDQLDGKSTSGESLREVSSLTDGKNLLSLQVLEIPTEGLGEGPQNNIAKLLDRVALQVSEQGGDLRVGLLLATEKEEQAEQLRQMAQGLIAMLDFAQSADPDDDDLKKVKELAKDVKANREGNEVHLHIKVSTKALTEMIEHELENDK